MRSSLILALGVVIASACSGPSPTSPGATATTVTLNGSDITYQRGPTAAVISMPVIAGLSAQPGQPGTVNSEFKSIGNGTFILARPITLDLNTDYWLAVRDPDFPTVCCWVSGDKNADVTVLGKRLTRSGWFSTGTNNNFGTAVQFVKISSAGSTRFIE